MLSYFNFHSDFMMWRSAIIASSEDSLVHTACVPLCPTLSISINWDKGIHQPVANDCPLRRFVGG